MNILRLIEPWAILLLCLVVGTASGQTPMEISAFGDLVLPFGSSETNGDQFQVNQAELDLTAEVGPGATADMALPYDPESGGFGLAVLAVDFAIHQQDGWDISVKAGQFDIPFGIDWRSYASVDRRMVTVPLMVDATHEGWNDLGATLHLERGPLALDAFLVNGSSCGRGQGTCKINREEVVRSFGARLGCAPLEGLELGFSGALFHDLDGTTVMTLWGADGQWRQGPWLVKGEYLQQIADQNTVAEATNDGAYLQVLRELGRTFVFARHDFLVHESKDSPDLQRWELGAGYVVRDGLEVRLEQQLGGASLGDMTWLQMVMTFGANN